VNDDEVQAEEEVIKEAQQLEKVESAEIEN